MRTSAGPLKAFSRLRRNFWALPLAVLAALVVVVINEAAHDRATTSLDSLAQRAQARTQIQRVWRLLIDAETGQRGYLLTGRPDYRQPFQKAVSEVHSAIGWLQRYYAGDAEAAPLLADIASHSATKLSEMGATMELHDRGRHGAWRELMLTDIGRERMDSLRQASARLLALETRRVDAERQQVVSTVRRARIGVNAMTVLSVLGLFFFLRQTLRFDRAQERHAQALQDERSRLAQEVAARTADLTELARHLQHAREDEKAHLARELHDELGALLTAAKLDSARLKRMLGQLSPDMQARLDHLNESLNRGIQLKRRIIEDLSPSTLRTMGLAAALEILVREFGARSEVRVVEQLQPVGLRDGAQITAYRLVQEALTNAAKYAGASEIVVSLRPAQRQDRPGAEVSVVDNGCGFDPAARRGGVHGLMGMRYRVEAEGGELALHSAPGQGTRIVAWLPEMGPLPDGVPALPDGPAPADADGGPGARTRRP